MKAFRKRFILLNVGLAGVVLLAAFGVIGFILCGNVYSEVRNTMSNVIKPWNTSAGASARSKSEETASSESSAEAKEKTSRKTQRPDEKKEEPPPKENKPDSPENNQPRGKRDHDDSITTLFYDADTKTASVLSETPVFEEDADVIAQTITAQQEDFGALNQYHILYYKEGSGQTVKIAVCSDSYIFSRLVKIVVVLVLVYLLTMGILLLISFRLSSFAEKPLRLAMQMERKFVADISHDLKTPITIIMANNSILRSRPDSSVSDNLKWVESTERVSEDMMQLVSRMLLMSSLDTQPGRLKTAAVSLSSAAQRCSLQLESMAYEKEVTMETDIEDDLIVNATEEYLKTICSCLLREENTMLPLLMTA